MCKTFNDSYCNMIKKNNLKMIDIIIIWKKANKNKK